MYIVNMISRHTYKSFHKRSLSLRNRLNGFIHKYPKFILLCSCMFGCIAAWTFIIKSSEATSDSLTKVISFVLYGTDSFFQFGALENVLLAQTLFPDWMVWICVESLIMQSNIVKELATFDNVEIIQMNDKIGFGGSACRFMPMFDETVDIVISRDTDSRLSILDVLTVDKWLQSDKDFHVMRGFNQAHDHKIMGGLWGARNHILREMKPDFDKFYQNKATEYKFGQDQIYLAANVYPQVADQVIAHDDWKRHWDSKEEKHKMPKPQNGDCVAMGNWVWDFPIIERVYGLQLSLEKRRDAKNMTELEWTKNVGLEKNQSVKIVSADPCYSSR